VFLKNGVLDRRAKARMDLSVSVDFQSLCSFVIAKGVIKKKKFNYILPVMTVKGGEEELLGKIRDYEGPVLVSPSGWLYPVRLCNNGEVQAVKGESLKSGMYQSRPLIQRIDNPDLYHFLSENFFSIIPNARFHNSRGDWLEIISPYNMPLVHIEALNRSETAWELKSGVVIAVSFDVRREAQKYRNLIERLSSSLGYNRSTLFSDGNHFAI